MFARIVTMPLKPGSASEYPILVENGAIPLLRTHKGFVDQITLVTKDGKIGLGISFWDTKESADDYSRSGFSDVMKSLEEVLSGPTQVKSYEVTNSTAHKITPAVVA